MTNDELFIQQIEMLDTFLQKGSISNEQYLKSASVLACKMKGCISGTQAAAADRIAIDVLKIPSLTLMENASFQAAEYIREHYGEEKRVLILCGTGNNGADGVCIGRMLLESGYPVRVLVCGNPEKETAEFRIQEERYKKAGGEISFFHENDVLPETELLVDAVFGTGLHRPVSGIYRTLIEAADALRTEEKIAVDIPSGINSDTGELMGAGIKADVTVTFGKNKTGLLIGEGRKYAGHVEVREIGIPEEAYVKNQTGEM